MDRKLTLDVTPLRQSPEFRRLWIGQAVSGVGGQMTVFAVALQVYLLTKSTLAVGVIGLCTVIPMLSMALVGGTLGDTYDRRKIVLFAGGGQVAVSLAFAVQAIAGNDRLWLLYALCIAQSTLGAVSVPAKRTFMAHLLPKDQIPAGAALTMLTMHFAGIAGPILAGAVAGVWGLQVCYAVDALSFIAAIYVVAKLPAMPPQGLIARPGAKAIVAALRYIRVNDVLRGAFLADLSLTLLATPTALLPAINDLNLGGKAETLGMLMAAPAVGGVLGSLFSGRAGRAARKGRGMLLAAGAWGTCIAIFGLAQVPVLAIALLVVAGVADVISVVFLTTIVQTTVDDNYRSRVSAVEFVVGAGGPQLGGMRAGALGAITSPGLSAVIGGATSVLAAALLAAALPKFVRWESEYSDRATTEELAREPSEIKAHADSERD
ncbi:MFS transporter [Streptomyces sp. H34-S4]|uniref:MFS transporter n=1 Tax=Streptomyces sp. H34-S4 TaxID=2996463 RepID=UPI00226EE0D8|nr:MFS transporter [Streptomyces sp. H34-S4]MCY0939109.1 MFS transporter [Streptomyces sp. H34-S4]